MLPENPETRWNATLWRHLNTTTASRIDVWPTYDSSFLSLPRAGKGMWDRIELSHMGENNGNPDLVCEKYHNRTLQTQTPHSGVLPVQRPSENTTCATQLKMLQMLPDVYPFNIILWWLVCICTILWSRTTSKTDVVADKQSAYGTAVLQNKCTSLRCLRNTNGQAS